MILLFRCSVLLIMLLRSIMHLIVAAVKSVSLAIISNGNPNPFAFHLG